MSSHGYPSSDPTAPPLRGGGQGYHQQEQYAAGSYGYGGEEHQQQAAAAAASRSWSSPAAAYGQTTDRAENPYTAAAAATAPYAPSSYATTTSSSSFATAGPQGFGSSSSAGYGDSSADYGHRQQQQQQQPASYYGQTAMYPPPYQAQYGRPALSFPPGTEAEIVRIFEQTDADRSGYIDASELGRVLSMRYTPFSSRTVRLILHLFAENQTDPTSLGPAGFVQAWRALNEWQMVFERFDRDRRGTIEQDELRDALLSLGLAIPSQILQMLMSKYDSTGRSTSIGYNNFIQCGLIVKGLTEKFKEKDFDLRGSATLDYTTFMLTILPFIIA